MPSATLAAGALAALVSGVIWGCLLAVVGELVLRAARRPTAATRYLVRFVVLTAAAAVVVVSIAGARPRPGVPLASVEVAEVAAPVPASWTIMVPAGDWASPLLVLMALTALARAARVGVKLRGVRRWKRESGSFELAAEPGSGGRGSLRRSATIDAPVAVGYLHPAILLPDALIRRLSETELRQVVAHERAHLARFDDWTALAQRAIEAVLFFHPAVRWLGRRLDLDREIACDDRVVAALAGERAYARCLARLAEAALASPGSLAAGVAPRASHLESRIRTLLGPRPSSPGVSVTWGAWAMVALAATGAVLPSTIPGFIVVPGFVAAPQVVAGAPVKAPASAPAPAPRATPISMVASASAAPAAVRPAPAAASVASDPGAPVLAAVEPEIAVACGAACAVPVEPRIVGAVPVPAPVMVARVEGKRREPVISGRPGGRRWPGITAGAPVTVISVGSPRDGLGLQRVGGALHRPMVGRFRQW